MPIVTLTNLSLAFGEDQVIRSANLNLESGERIAFSGRNGAGKSTLLKLICGDAYQDEGLVWRAESLTFATLAQALPEREAITVFEAVSRVFETVGLQIAEYHSISSTLTDNRQDLARLAHLQDALDASDGWSINHRIDATLNRLGLDPEALLTTLSGGWLKRIAIAQSLVQDPDVWILDEPTNHLDLEGIEWLEDKMLTFPGTLLFVSHDRKLMQSVATSIIEIDRGNVTRWDCDYTNFILRRDETRATELEHNKKFDDRLNKEEVWIRQGIKARRTRNEGRVRALEALRAERSKRIAVKDLRLQVDKGASSGKIVKETIALTKKIDDKFIIRDLNLIIQRGDRIGLLGPNGCGKTTLLKLLLEKIRPDSGTVKTGTKLDIAYFDQIREQLNPAQSVTDYISEGREFITIADKQVHVISYLGNFLFDPDQSRSPIRTLSGGEQNRLLLAKLFSLPANLLVLDEPTNDLDIETLELLEELLIEYQGTVLLVSHDRTFMDNVVSSLLVFEGDGLVVEHVGGFSDWQTGAKARSSRSQSSTKLTSGSGFEDRKKAKNDTQKRQRELEKTTEQIDSSEAQLKSLHAQIAAPTFYDLSISAQQACYDQVALLERKIAELLHRWEELELN